MNNSVETGPSWNGQRALDYQAQNGLLPPGTNNSEPNLLNDKCQYGSAGHSSRPGLANSVSGPYMNNNANAALLNPGLVPTLNQPHPGPSQTQLNSNQGFGTNPDLLQRTGSLNMQTMLNQPPQLNGYQSTPTGQTTVNVNTPSSVGARFPMWDMDIPSQMFMQAINFEQLIGNQNGLGPPSAASNVMNSTRLSEQSNHKSEAGLDLLEQQQAMEQARLLQRFKELRQWQQQQQELLMNQQQQQLSMLRREQQRVQNIITKQRDQQWGGGKANTFSETATPPKHHLPPGTDIARLRANGMIPTGAGIQQAQTKLEGGLPKPVIYVETKDDDDEIKTNPDLFSDTNSNRGSQAGLDEGVYPIPDSASEASVDVRQFQGQPKLYQPRFSKQITESPRISHHHSVLEVESDDLEQQSFQSPTLPASKPPPTSVGSQGESVEQSSEAGDSSDGDSDDDDDDSNDDDDDYEVIDEGEEEEDEQQTTQIEVQTEGLNYDEIPIKTAIEGPKSFEQLLEEQLKAEEERLKQASGRTDSPSHPKRNFLKKGEGISRFEMRPGQRPPRPKKLSSKTTISQSSLAQKSSTSGSNSESQKTVSQTYEGSHTANKSNKVTTKKANQSGKSGTQPNSKMSSGEKPVSGSNSKSGQSNKPPKATEQKNKKASHKSPVHDHQQLSRDPNTGNQKEASKKSTIPLKKIKAPESIPDDTSFVASLKERQKESERDLEELDEFEILEELADNMSFCSNSSIVTKGIHGLQSDRILTGILPKVSGPGKPNSKPLEMTGQSLNTGQTHQAVVRPFSFQIEPQNKEAESHNQKLGDQAERKNSNNNRNIDDADDSDDETSSSDDDSDEYETESDADQNKDNADINKNAETLVNAYNIGNKENLRPTHNEFNHVGNKGISKIKTEKEEARKETRVTTHDFDKERKMLTFSDSEFNESENEETDLKQSGYEAQESRSPMKVLTRKVAVRDDKKTGTDTRILLQKVTENSDPNLLASLDSSAFAPKAKSPLVISKEKIVTSKVPFRIDLKDDKFVYHSDSDSNGNKLKEDLSEDESSDTSETELKSKPVKFNERKTLQFDDDDEWEENTPVLSRTKEKKKFSGSEDHDSTLVEDSEKKNKHTQEKTEDASDTPPTSKLVSKLFPKLKTHQEKQEQENQSKIQTVSQASMGDGIQSKALRDKLIELEREIEKFRNENSHLAKLRAEREEALAKLKREIADFEKEKMEELKRLEEFKNEEMKKLKHERKMFDKYQKAARACPDKKEREEIETLKSQLTELQEEMKRKESRWSTNNSRLRTKLELLEQENVELKEEIKLMEKKRLEWLQKDQNKNKNPPVQLPVRSSTPTPEEEAAGTQLANTRLAANFGQDQFNDLSTASSIRSNMSLNPSQYQPKVNVRSSFPPHSKGPPPASTVSHTKSSSSSNQSSNAKTNAKTNTHNTKVNQTTSNSSHGSKQYGGHLQQGQKKHKARQGTKIQDGGKAGSQAEKNVLRNSLTEDIPRRELGTVAEPQDVSIYSETDAEASVLTPANIPRKTAATNRVGVDKSIIDKGDNDYEETQHSDGKVERVYNNGAREILFSNGTRKEISADGQSIVVSFFNGDIKQIMPDQRVIYYYADTQTTHINYPDGLEILQFPNNQIEKLYPDGTKEITFTDQTIKYVFPNGSEESIFPDGTVIRLDKNGDKTMEFPNGQREIHTQEYKKREYPDGTVKTVYPDGRQETRYSNGRLRVKDKDGNVIVDRHY